MRSSALCVGVNYRIDSRTKSEPKAKQAVIAEWLAKPGAASLQAFQMSHLFGIEIGIPGTGATVANAIYNETGKRVRDLRITLDKPL